MARYEENLVLREGVSSTLAVNSVIRNTYILLSMTLLFSAAMAGFSMLLNAPPMPLLSLVGTLGLLFLVQATQNSAAGIVSVFALTGFMGFTLGPILNLYLNLFTNGGQLIMSALGATGLVFFGLSGYALTTRKDFSYLAGFLMVAMMAALLACLASIFFAVPALHLMISAGFVLISSGLILLQTSQIINGGERNYIAATVSLYVSIYNLFTSLLHILAAFSGRQD